uniref:Uncharacterized protein n=1 Tax=Tanacetum cinerariifolium TaxID=118510 RepID=A0A699GSA3_TANCI|nr:hypothetical protein [Tanacetum cinerariifolium]
MWKFVERFLLLSMDLRVLWEWCSSYGAIDIHVCYGWSIYSKKKEEKQIEKEQAAKAQNLKIPACYDDDDDYNFAITPNEPVASLSMGVELLNTIPATELDEFIKSSVGNLVPNQSESEGENGYDVPACFTTFSNALFDADYDFYSSDDQSLSHSDILEKIFLNPLFDEEIISMKIDSHHFNTESVLIESLLNHDSSIISSSLKIDPLLNELLYDNSSPRPSKEFVSENSYAEIKSFSPSPIPIKDSDSLIEEIDLSFTLDDPMLPGIEDDDYDFEMDIISLKNCLTIIPFHSLKLSHTILIFLHYFILLQNHQMEKSPDLLSHRSRENIKPSAKWPMMIHGKNTPILDVPLFHFPPLSTQVWGELFQAQ